MSEGKALFFLHNKHSFTGEYLNKGNNEKGETALFVAACYSGNEAILHWLFDRNVRLDEQCRDGATALHGAALGKHKGAIELLLQKGAKKDVKNYQKQTVMEESPEIMTEVPKELENPDQESEGDGDDEDDASWKKRSKVLEKQVAAQRNEIQELRKKDSLHDQEIQDLK